MGKKRVRDAEAEMPDKMERDDGSDFEEFDSVDIEFEWFNFDPTIDFQGTKTLLRQLFDVDATLFDLSGLADLILSQPTIGSTVKVDGKENDAYAALTALNMREHHAKKPMASLASYVVEKAGSNPALAPLSVLLGDGEEGSSAQVGLLLSERLINMPFDVVPPMYTMLIDEIEAAVEDGEPYNFTHYLLWSRTYAEVESALDAETSGRKNKRAREENTSTAPLFYYHAEDEVLQRYALAHGSFQYTKGDEAAADSKRAFQDTGIKSQGHFILIEAAKFAAAVEAVQTYLSSQS